MKYIRNTVIAAIAIILTHSVHAWELGVDEIKVLDQRTIEVSLSENPNLGNKPLDAEVAVLNDIPVEALSREIESDNEILLTLDQDILSGMKYSLVTISWAKGSIDFITPEIVIGYEAQNADLSLGQDISSIEVLDERNIKIAYNEPLEWTATEYEYKVLLENTVQEVIKKDYMEPELTITLTSDLQSDQQYILMFIDIQDASGAYLDFDTWIYDFETQEIENTKTSIQEEIKEETQETEETTTNEVKRTIDTNAPQEGIVITPLNSAPSLQKSSDWVKIVENVGTAEELEETLDDEILKVQTIEDIKNRPSQITHEESTLETQENNETEVVSVNLQKVALSATETPATWAATWVLVIMSIVINTFYHFTRRKSYKLI